MENAKKDELTSVQNMVGADRLWVLSTERTTEEREKWMKKLEKIKAESDKDTNAI